MSIGARWESVAERVLSDAGYDVHDSAGVADYQGWMCLMGKHRSIGNEFAILAYSYGSCSGCDRFEDLSNEDREKEFHDLIVPDLSLEQAQRLFDARKGW
jgi:tryptophan synthase alpha subunit